MAGIAGLLAVIVVMLVYYKRSGVNAVLALVLNHRDSHGGALLFPRRAHAAGNRRVILTIGMAVDSNVLIFERIREEFGPARQSSRPWTRVSIKRVDHCRHPRDHGGFVRLPLPVREGPVRGSR